MDRVPRPVLRTATFSKVYALDSEPGVKAGASKADVLKATKDHILAEGHTMGTYKRR